MGDTACNTLRMFVCLTTMVRRPVFSNATYHGIAESGQCGHEINVQYLGDSSNNNNNNNNKKKKKTPNTKHQTPNTKHQTTNNQQPTTNNKQPTTNNKQQTTNNKQQTTNNKQRGYELTCPLA